MVFVLNGKRKVETMEPIIATEGSKVYQLAPAGTFQAVCFGAWDIYWHKNNFGTVQRKVVVGWEISETMSEGEQAGKRFCVYKQYTLSLNEKANLRKDLESWRGKAFTPDELRGFDITKLVGANCMLSIIHTEKGPKTYVNVTSVARLMKGLTPMKQENVGITPKLVEVLREKAASNSANKPEDIHDEEEAPAADGEDSDIPF